MVAKTLSSRAVLLVLLALQLVLGLQLQAAQAVASPMHASMLMTTRVDGVLAGVAGASAAPAAGVSSASLAATGMTSVPASSADAAAQPDCPNHSTARGTASGVHSETNSSGHSGHAPWGKHAPMGTHDCCHASACQCHCVYTPGAISLPALANIATSVAIPSLANTQVVAPRIDEFLRPPIA